MRFFTLDAPMVRGDVTSDLAVLANLAEITNKSAADHHCRWLTHSIKFQRTCQARPKQPIRPNNNVNFSTRNESQFFDLTSCINNFWTTLRRYYIKPDILWTSDGSILTVFNHQVMIMFQPNLNMWIEIWNSSFKKYFS